MKAWVYILKDDNEKFYIGSTDNLERRLKQHAQKHTQTTSRMINPKLVLTQQYESLVIVRRIENKLKRMKRKDFIEKIVSDGYIKIKSQ